MQVKRLVVGKGKTARPNDAEMWTKAYYELEAVIEDVEDLANLENVRELLEGKIDGWLSLSKPTVKPAAIPSQALPQLDPDELAKLPWKTYKTKTDCKPEEAGWIFRNTLGAEALANLIEKQGKGTPVQIGPNKFECSFSGAERQFISRKPVK